MERRDWIYSLTAASRRRRGLRRHRRQRLRLRQSRFRQHRVRRHLGLDCAACLHGQYQGRSGASGRLLVYVVVRRLRDVADRRGVSIRQAHTLQRHGRRAEHEPQRVPSDDALLAVPIKRPHNGPSRRLSGLSHWLCVSTRAHWVACEPIPPLLALKPARKMPAVDNRGRCVESGAQVQAAVTDSVPDIDHLRRIQQKPRTFPPISQ